MQRITACAALYCVVSASAVQFVEPSGSVQKVVFVIAGQGIAVVRAEQVLDQEQQVAFRMAAMLRAAIKSHAHSAVGSRVGCGVNPWPAYNPIASFTPLHGIVPIAAINRIASFTPFHGIVSRLAEQKISAAPAIQLVVSIPAIEDVVCRIAGQHVVVSRPDNVLEARKHIASRIAATALRGCKGEVHCYACGGKVV